MCQQLIKRQEATCQVALRTRGNAHQGRGGANHGSSWETAARQQPAGTSCRLCAGAQWRRVEQHRQRDEQQRRGGDGEGWRKRVRVRKRERATPEVNCRQVETHQQRRYGDSPATKQKATNGGDACKSLLGCKNAPVTPNAMRFINTRHHKTNQKTPQNRFTS